MTTSYSTKPLAQKLGIKTGQRIIILNSPQGFWGTLGPLPADVEVAPVLEGQFDFIHFFSTRRAELEADFPRLKASLRRTGMLWISWPKKAARMPTDLDDTVVRITGLTGGLVDIKVAAVDVTWSGLKFVYRRTDR